MEGLRLPKVRAGWRQQLRSELADALSGPAAGLGFKASLLQLDYAYVPHGPFPAAHRLSATLNFGDEIFKPKVVVQSECPTITARIFSEHAEGYAKTGQKLETLVAFKQAQAVLTEAE